MFISSHLLTLNTSVVSSTGHGNCALNTSGVSSTDHGNCSLRPVLHYVGSSYWPKWYAASCFVLEHGSYQRMLSTPSMWSRVYMRYDTELMCLRRLEAYVGACYITTRFVQALRSPPRTKSTAGWDVTRCSVVDFYRLFLSPCFLRNFWRRWRQRVDFLCIYCTSQNTLRHIPEYWYIDIFVNCSWVDTRWQYTFTHNQHIEDHD
jgi:hypothetical protein